MKLYNLILLVAGAQAIKFVEKADDIINDTSLIMSDLEETH